MRAVTFADVVHQSLIFSKDTPAERMVLELIDTPWVQRLRDISQTANTRLVYMFSEHSRFGHSLGVAYLATRVLQNLGTEFPERIEPFRCAVSAAALLHDIGHLAPGSHTAFRTWFPEVEDSHEEISVRVVRESPEIASIFAKYGAQLAQQVAAILEEREGVPAWCWELISGGGWNVDRGNWCIVDSLLAGVSYGHYNIPALTDSITLSPSDHLALAENRLDAMMHFAVSRHAMYRQVYQHRVLLSADTLNRAIAERARDLGAEIPFADAEMRAVLAAKSPRELSTDIIFTMREPWWRYHLMQWRKGGDAVLSDLSDRLMHRRLFKTIRLRDGEQIEELKALAEDALRRLHLDPRYYLHEVSTADMHASDSKQSMRVQLDDGNIRNLTDADPLFRAMVSDSAPWRRRWLVVPSEVKVALGRER